MLFLELAAVYYYWERRSGLAHNKINTYLCKQYHVLSWIARYSSKDRTFTDVISFWGWAATMSTHPPVRVLAQLMNLFIHKAPSIFDLSPPAQWQMKIGESRFLERLMSYKQKIFTCLRTWMSTRLVRTIYFHLNHKTKLSSRQADTCHLLSCANSRSCIWHHLYVYNRN